MYFSILGFGTGLVLLLLLAFGVLQWLQVPAGGFVDWIIGAASFWWLLAITTVPWNVHFEAKQVIADAKASQDSGITVEPEKIQYAQLIARRSLLIAITLHTVSAIGLYTLSATGITPVGYVSAGAALLLTALRPAVETYQYLSARLAMIRQEFKYPRDDIQEVLTRLSTLETNIKDLTERLDPDDERSWATTLDRRIAALRQDTDRLATAQETYKATNQAEHQRLSREAEQAISRLSSDGQFLDHVREIIRFFKTA